MTLRESICLAAACIGGPVAALPAAADGPEVTMVVVDPAEVVLTGADSRFQLLVTGTDRQGREVDLTPMAAYQSSAPGFVSVDARGELTAVADGEAVIAVEAGGIQVQLPVRVEGTGRRGAINFERDIVPILSKYGCNASGCHGKAEGQNGFKLSVFGSDPPADHAALTREARGRRVFAPDPARSLLLQKASGGVPHGGGVRIARDGAEYRLLREWIALGTPLGESSDPQVVAVEVAPRERQLGTHARQQLRVTATYSDGSRRDVTAHARYQSNYEALAVVDEHGLVSTQGTPGEATVMAAYLGAIDVFRAQVPQAGQAGATMQPPVYNFIDPLVDDKLHKLNITPSELCSDSDFVRRACLDIIGTLPTADEARAFLLDQRADKRQQLVDALLQRPEYADYRALQWADLLRVDRGTLNFKGAYQYYRWIHDCFAANRRFDEFARDVITAEGPVRDAPAGRLFQVVPDPGDMANTVSQVFLGVRIECAKCHHHPYDRWSQSDFYGMQAHFTQVGFKPSPQGDVLTTLGTAGTTHPRTGETILAHPLGTAPPETGPIGDRRQALAGWMTSADNPWFARNAVNRTWAHLLGRGLVEPVDDVRLTNPPSNPALLDALAGHFVASGFDLHDLIRTITASRTYQLSAEPNESNRIDEQNYSRALLKRMDAEVLLDAICQVTGVPEKFDGHPSGSRAIQLWDSQAPHYFLRLFGRPQRTTPCECERNTEPAIAQVLHVLNSPEIEEKLGHAGGRIAQLRQAHRDDDRALVQEVYLWCYARFPDDEELKTALAYLSRDASKHDEAAEDLAWGLMNTTEFLFNH